MTLPKLRSIALPKTPRKTITAFVAKETQTQQAFIVWCRLIESEYPALKLGFAVPNGGKRSIKTAVTLKKEGVKSGVPDWMLPIARGGWTGFAIEFKRKGNTTTDDQDDYIERLVQEGWLVHIHTCHAKAGEETLRYLRQPKQQANVTGMRIDFK